MRYTLYFNKPVCSLLVLLVMPCIIFAQRTVPVPYSNTIKVNYIRSWDAKAPEQSAATLITRPLRDVQQSTQYFDGLGRPLQTVVKEGSMVTGSAATDMVSMTEYDAFGREPYKYLPTPSTSGTTNNGLFKLNPFVQQASFYNSANANSPIAGQGETWFYGVTSFEASPLNRVQEQFAAGNSWAATSTQTLEANHRSVKIKYSVNTAADSVRTWNVTDAALGSWGSYATTTTYPAGQLYKTITIDEHNKQVIEFKDKEGKVILKKVQLTGADDTGAGQGYTGWVCTYYIYDDLGNLRCVIQPEGVLATRNNGWVMPAGMVDGLCFRYEYDSRNRVIMKEVPGADPVYMVYDARDRLVMTQDGRQRVSSNIWIVTVYDELNRPVLNGSLQNSWFTPATKTFVQHLTDAAASTGYPFTLSTVPAAATWVERIRTGYDNYLTLPAGTGLSSTLNTTYTTNASYVYTTYNTSPAYAQQLTQSLETTGLVTWTKTLIVGSSVFLYTVNIYDDKARLIQVQSKNRTGGVDITTTQYNWAGQPLRVVQQSQKAGINPQTAVMLTQLSYDDLGRLAQTDKKIQHTLVNSNALPSAWTTVSKNEYDALGQLKKKELGKIKNTDGSYSTTPIEYLNYTYNIRGWLLNINKGLLGATAGTMPVMGTGGNYFGMELGYDKLTSAAAGNSYTAGQYNGNIAGMVWRSRGDQANRKYDFSYDALNRLTAAAFKQNGAATGDWGTSATNTAVDFSVSNLTYDLNGNIKTMNQMGLKLNSSSLIDQLTYKYNDLSNRLGRVTEAVPVDPTSRLGDFKDGANVPGTNDYNYNENGSVVKDLNKGISTINYYSTMNLPYQVTFAGGAVSYSHDANGNKTTKTTVETSATVPYNGSNITGSITTTTTYLGGFVYESKAYEDPTLNGALGYTDKLLFAAQEEGRIRFTPTAGTVPAKFSYDYFVKDHLGNVRMVLTEEQQQDVYPAATLEGSLTTDGSPNAAFKEKDYYTIDATYAVPSTTATGITAYTNKNGGTLATDAPVNPNPNSVVTASSAKLYKLKSTVNKTGLGITLKVMAGDKIDIFGKSYYFTNNTGGTGANSAIPVIDILTGLLGGPTGSAVAASHGGVTGTTLSGSTASTGGITSLLGSQTTDAAGAPTVPKAYINYIFFDEQFTTESSGFSKVGSNSVVKTHTDLTNIAATKNGFVYIYVSNESPVDVFFDNLQVIHTRGPILEETHYYPFGLTMAGISSRAMGKLENKIKFQGQEFAHGEFSDGSGLDLYEFKYRSHDPQIGRFLQVDPLADKYVYNSTYAFSENRVINARELEGLEAVDAYHSTMILENGTQMIEYFERSTNPLDARPQFGTKGTLTHVSYIDLSTGFMNQFSIYQPDPPADVSSSWFPQMMIFGAGNDFDMGNPIDYSKPVATLNLGKGGDGAELFDLISLFTKANIPKLGSNRLDELLNRFPGLVNSAKNRATSNNKDENKRKPASVKYDRFGNPYPEGDSLHPNGIKSSPDPDKPDTMLFDRENSKTPSPCIGCVGPWKPSEKDEKNK